ncbi:unnamed protein product [Thlaspi arvense]|uniref:TAFII28-like protein domain-containing protein n=1 Tax=Thlaspi arvense TaxID=13288 RepID=A0AAU9RQ23_THLAR|nr:unnamed protein product [Thlaspi arvense]
MKDSKDTFEEAIDDERIEMEQPREEEDVEYATSVKIAKRQAILSQFTEDQMSRYESFRRSTLSKSNMKTLIKSITGINSLKDDDPVVSVVRGIAKMFAGDLVETARIVMSKSNETGPIRPCHIRESYRRLKLQGKVPRRSVPRLFR